MHRFFFFAGKDSTTLELFQTAHCFQPDEPGLSDRYSCQYLALCIVVLPNTKDVIVYLKSRFVVVFSCRLQNPDRPAAERS